MIDFTNAKMEAEPWPFVMPQKDCIYLREKLARVMEDGMQQAADAAAQGLADGDFSSDMFDEDFFVPTPKGLFFPKHGEAGECLSYDDPAAEPYLQILRDSGWEGQIMVL